MSSDGKYALLHHLLYIKPGCNVDSLFWKWTALVKWYVRIGEWVESGIREILTLLLL